MMIGSAVRPHALRLQASRGRCAGLSGADSYCLFQFADEDPTVADPSCSRDIRDRLEYRLDDAVVYRNFDFRARSKLCLINFGDSDALNSQLRDRLPQLVQLEWPHDRGNHFHDVHFAMIETLIGNALISLLRVFLVFRERR